MARNTSSHPGLLFADQSHGPGRRGHILRFHEFVEHGWIRVLTPIEKDVWLALEHFAYDGDGGLVTESTIVIAKAVGHETAANVRKARRALVKLGLIEVVQEGGGGEWQQVRMLVPGDPKATGPGRQRLGLNDPDATAPRLSSNRVPGSDLTGSEPSDPVEIEPPPGSVSTAPRLSSNRVPGSDPTAHYIRRHTDVFDVNDVHTDPSGSAGVVEPKPEPVNPKAAGPQEPPPDAATLPEPRPPPPSRPAADEARPPAPAATCTAEEIYAAYPRKVKKPDALKAIDKAIVRIRKRGEPPTGFADWAGWLLFRTTAYGDARRSEIAVRPEAAAFTPYPATFFNADQFDEETREWAPTAHAPNGAPNGRSHQHTFTNGSASARVDAARARPASPPQFTIIRG